MKRAILILVAMALVIGLCVGVASAKSDNGKGLGQEQTLLQQQVGTQEFSDVEGHWAAWAIKKAQSKGLMLGHGDGTFGPDQPLTKAEALVLLGRLTGDTNDNDDKEADDEDVDDDADVDEDADMKGVPAWARESVQNAVYKGYIKRFHSETQCQRAYAFALIAQELGDKLPPLPDEYVNHFKDLIEEDDIFAGLEEEMELTSAEIFEFMMRLHNAGIIKGSDGNLNPNGGLKRAEIAVLLDKLEQYQNEEE